MSSALQRIPWLGRHDATAGAAAVIAVHGLAVWLLLHEPPVAPELAPQIISISLLATLAPSEPAPVVPPSQAAPSAPPALLAVPIPPQAAEPPKPVVVKRISTPPVTEKPIPVTTAEAGTAFHAPSTLTAPASASPKGGEPVPVLVAPRFDAAYLNNPPPSYPPMSRRLGEQGRVVVRVFVDTSGAPAQVELRESSGHPRLDAAAASAVRRWRFVPARRGAEPVGAWVLVPISFNLRS